MSNHNRIVPLNAEATASGDAGSVVATDAYAAEPVAGWAGEDEPAAHVSRGWIAPALALVATLGWTAWFVWARQGEMLGGASPARWTQWLGEWAVPVLLIGVGWLLAMRSSRREALRFGDAARVLRQESQALETRLTTVNRELSLAREFLAAQSRDLEAMGRMASERLSVNADKLQGLIRDNGAQVDAIGTVSSAALENMERLRDQLPVLAGSAKDVTNNIGNAGRTAHAQLHELIAGFQRLNEFGQASERQALSVRGEIDSAVGEFRHHADALETLLTTRLTALREQSADVRAEIDTHEAAALESWRTRVNDMDAYMRDVIAALDRVDESSHEAGRARLDEIGAAASQVEEQIAARREQFDAEMARRNSQTAADHDAALAHLTSIFTQFDDNAATRAAQQREQADRIARHAAELGDQLDAIGQRMNAIAVQSREAEGRVAEGVDSLTARLGQTRDALAGTDSQIATLTDSSVRLLELIQAGVQHSTHDLPQAISVSDARLAEIEDRVTALVEATGTARDRGEALSSYVLASGDDLARTAEKLADAQAAFEARTRDHGALLADLSASLDRLRQDSEKLSESAQGELTDALAKLDAATRASIDTIGEMAARQVEGVAAELGEKSGAMIETVLRERADQAAGQLEAAALAAAQISREAMVQLRNQLAKVNELAGNLERRVVHARERAEEQVDNDFSRRVALINESLNSNAIDIARALSADVADTAWASYLKGDRGIFTRRAVNLMDNADAKAVAQLYEDDAGFRDHVSRYIHDFEAMLRQLLSTRDGHAISVTLLSSDLGKLYVALAQAIERLRT